MEPRTPPPLVQPDPALATAPMGSDRCPCGPGEEGLEVRWERRGDRVPRSLSGPPERYQNRCRIPPKVTGALGTLCDCASAGGCGRLAVLPMGPPRLPGRRDPGPGASRSRAVRTILLSGRASAEITLALARSGRSTALTMREGSVTQRTLKSPINVECGAMRPHEGVPLTRGAVPDLGAVRTAELWSTFAPFALSYYAYDHHTDVGARANRTREAYRATGELPETESELRLALFFEQRRWRHFGVDPDEEAWAYIGALLGRLKAVLPE